MASLANQFTLFILFITLSLHTHARDPQFFNKIPSTTTKNVVVPNNNKTPLLNQQEEQQPDFLPDNENSYGLYGHESGQLPPSATTTAATEAKQPLPKYLPKNYNPTAYVTQPEDMTPYTEDKSYTSTTNPNGNGNYYNNQQEEEEEPEYTNNGNNYNYRLGSSFNSQPQGLSDTRENYKNVNGEVNRRYYQPRGMSDTRLVENGKYFYDLNSEKYSNNHPYERLRGRNDEYNNRNYYANSENYMGGGYENQVDDNNVMP